MALTTVPVELANLDGAVTVNESSADVDFRIESDTNANSLFLEGSTSHIGLGTGSPDDNGFGAGHGILAVASATGSAKTAMLNLMGDGNDTDATRVASVFFNDQSATGAGKTLAGVEAYRASNHATDPGADLVLSTNVSGGSYTQRMRIFADGSVGLGPNWNGTKDSSFKVMADQSGWASVYHNDGNGSNRYGIKIGCGADNAAGTNYAMGFDNGDFTSNQGYITFSGGTVTYGAFTAHHPCVIPDADNDPDSSENAYPYGTLLETTSLSYTQTEETDTERGIRYNVQKSSGAYSKKVLGAYGSSMNDAPHNPDNEHQALILGDGHILCNNEKGNISVGDGICTSTTAGIGMKADKMAMIIGIAQEDVTFSGSETKLVAVQYGLQQFTPWTD